MKLYREETLKLVLAKYMIEKLEDIPEEDIMSEIKTSLSSYNFDARDVRPILKDWLHSGVIQVKTEYDSGIFFRVNFKEDLEILINYYQKVLNQGEK